MDEDAQTDDGDGRTDGARSHASLESGSWGTDDGPETEGDTTGSADERSDLDGIRPDTGHTATDSETPDTGDTSTPETERSPDADEQDTSVGLHAYSENGQAAPDKTGSSADAADFTTDDPESTTDDPKSLTTTANLSQTSPNHPKMVIPHRQTPTTQNPR